MRWIELATYKKDIPAGEKLALYSNDGKSECWTEGYLLRIEYSGATKNFIFRKGDEELTFVTHFMQIEPPKPKE